MAGIRRRPVPRRILVLCLGNICRSPYVAASLEKAAAELGLEFEVRSGGFIGPGRPPPPEALDAAAGRGVDTRGHLSRVEDREGLDEADLVILVDPAHAPRLRKTLGPHDTPVLVLSDLDPDAGDSRTIRDPWGNEPEVFHQVFQRLDRCTEALLAEWSARTDG